VKSKIILSLTILFIFITSTIAQPRKLDDILITSYKWQMDTLLIYNNVTYQFLDKKESVEENILNYTVNLRYNLLNRIQIMGFASIDTRSKKRFLEDDNKVKKHTETEFNGAGIGITYHLLHEGTHPGLIFSALTNIVDKQPYVSKNDYFKTFSFYLTSYYSVDPVVFFIQGLYQLNLDRDMDGKTLQVGDVFAITPQVYFLANPYVSFNFGIKWLLKEEDKYDDDILFTSSSSLGWLFGFSYEIAENTLISLDTEFRNQANFVRSSAIFRLVFRF